MRQAPGAVVELVCIRGRNKGQSFYLDDLRTRAALLSYDPAEGLLVSDQEEAADARLSERSEGAFFLEADESRGVMVNDGLVVEETQVEHGDTIDIGGARAVFVLPDPRSLAQVVRKHLEAARTAQQNLRALRVATQHCLHSLKNEFSNVEVWCDKAQQAALNLEDGPGQRAVLENLDKALTEIAAAIAHAREYQGLGEVEEQSEPHRETVDLCQLCREASAGLLLPSHVQLELRLCERELQASVDPVQIADVIRELLQNAVDYLQDEPEARITLSCRAATPSEVEKQQRLTAGLPYGQVEVRQTGRPLTPEIREKLFKPFETTKGKGLGIGLWLAHDVLDLHYGLLTEESGPHEGARFILFLPLTDQQRGN